MQEHDIMPWFMWVKIFSSTPSFRQYRYYSKYFNYEPRFNGVFSRDNLPRIKDETLLLNFDDKQSEGTQWVLFSVDRNTTVCFDFF